MTLSSRGKETDYCSKIQSGLVCTRLHQSDMCVVPYLNSYMKCSTSESLSNFYLSMRLKYKSVEIIYSFTLVPKLFMKSSTFEMGLKGIARQVVIFAEIVNNLV